MARTVAQEDAPWTLAVPPTATLGESPMWHPVEQALYYCDIAGHEVRRHHPATGALQHWSFGTDVASLAAAADGSLLVARRDGLWHFDPRSGDDVQVAAPPYDPAAFRFNDGKCDPQGRFWVGTLSDARQPHAALYRLDADGLQRVAEGLTVSNGLGFSPDGRTAYWSDTTAHAVMQADLDPASGAVAHVRPFIAFPRKSPEQALATYGGRPDGAAVDAEGCYWVALFEGARVLRVAPTGEVLRDLRLPVQCPTMPCLGGPDLRTLYVTTSREKRPAAELAVQPWAGGVLALPVDVPGLPTSWWSPIKQ